MFAKNKLVPYSWNLFLLLFNLSYLNGHSIQGRKGVDKVPQLDLDLELSKESAELFRKNAVDSARAEIKKEMKGYEYQTGRETELILEKGGKPIRNLIVSTWRSGSSFLGSVVASHPGSFHFYEPLQYFNNGQIRSGKAGEAALHSIRNQLSCNFTAVPDLMTYTRSKYLQFNRNPRVWKYCKGENESLCVENGQFMSEMCKLFPFQIMKTVRLRLRLAKELLEDENFDMRILLLVRDPRGVMQSRNKCSWCLSQDCLNQNRLCMDLEDDFAEAELLREKYPDQFLAIRFEDMALNMEQGIAKVMKFFRLQFHPKVKEYLKSHTKDDHGILFRNSTTVPYRWREELAEDSNQLKTIQESCKKAMNFWGYAPATSDQPVMNLNPLLSPPWQEMSVI